MPKRRLSADRQDGRRPPDDTPRPDGGDADPDERPGAAREEASDPGGILVVDDNEDCRLALRAILESLGYAVYEAEDGEAAVRAAREVQPALILMDIMMPEVDGLEATRRIRSSGSVGRVRIVAVSAMEGAEQASLSAGCDDCLLKPIDMGELGALVEKWIGGS